MRVSYVFTSLFQILEMLVCQLVARKDNDSTRLVEGHGIFMASILRPHSHAMPIILLFLPNIEKSAAFNHTDTPTTGKVQIMQAFASI